MRCRGASPWKYAAAALGSTVIKEHEPYTITGGNEDNPGHIITHSNHSVIRPDSEKWGGLQLSNGSCSGVGLGGLCCPAYRDNGISMALRLRARPQALKRANIRTASFAQQTEQLFSQSGYRLANIVISICQKALNSEGHRRLPYMWEVCLRRLTLVEFFLL
jgi:hypothetical protein